MPVTVKLRPADVQSLACWRGVDCAALAARLASPPMSANEARVFTLGHSPDPDDAFMFYAMAEHKIDLRGYKFEHRLEDIQTLNERALRASWTSPRSRSTPTRM
jgi:hypothetical protein